MEHLIQLVQDHPVLYDTSNEDYMRGKMKDDIWEKIAKELNYTSGQMAKAQWKKLRDCYRDALRRQTKKADKVPVLFGHGSIRNMEFLIPYMNNRNTSSNLTGTEGSTSTVQVEFNEDVDSNPDATTSNNELAVADPILADEEIQITNKKKTKKLKTSDLNEAFMKSLNNYEKRANARNELRKSVADNAAAQMTTDDPTKNDPLYQFFTSMYNTTKNMPLTYQLQVKKKVFQTVSEAEEEILMANMTSGQSSWVLTSGPSSESSDQAQAPLSTYWSDFGQNQNAQ